MTGVPQCISCGMPMRTAADHAKGDLGTAFCAKCATPSGELKSYDEVLEGFVHFMQSTQGLAPEVARGMASDMLARNPAWKQAGP